MKLNILKIEEKKLTINNQNNNSKKVGFSLTKNLSFRKTQRKTILTKNILCKKDDYVKVSYS